MKSRRLLALAFASCLLFPLSPGFGLAQTMSTGAPGGTSTGSTGSGVGSSGGIGSTGGIGTSSTNSTTRGVTQIGVQTITSGTGSATATPSNSNSFVSTYGDPLSWGMPSKYATTFGPLAKPTVTFGKGIYTTTATSAGAGTASTTTQANGFTTTGIVRNPQYTTVLSDEIPMVVHPAAAVQADLRAIIDRSSFIKSQGAIQIFVSGNTVQLVGQVATEKEYRLVEGMVRTTPGVAGVRDVQNDLKISQVKVSAQ